MEVYVNRISGIPDAIVSMYMSQRSWSWELENSVYYTCDNVLNYDGSIKNYADDQDLQDFHAWFSKVLKWGKKHVAMLRFIDITVSVSGLHRGGQDDWDSHAKRFDNRIIRNSTRVKKSNFQYEMSSFYQDKIICTDVALSTLGINVPDKIVHNGKTYVKAVNGYIEEHYKDDPDVKRGLYMLSIPSDFIFKINLTEWSHVYKLRNKNTTANPEVRQCCEMICDQLEAMHSELNRDLFNAIEN